MKKIFYILPILAIMFMANSAMAYSDFEKVYDSSSGDSDCHLPLGSGGDRTTGMRLKLAEAYNMAFTSWWIAGDGSTGTYTLKIFSDNGGNPDVLIAESDIGAFIDVDYTAGELNIIPPLHMEADTYYWFVFYAQGSSQVRINKVDGGGEATENHILSTATNPPTILDNVTCGGGETRGVSGDGIIGATIFSPTSTWSGTNIFWVDPLNGATITNSKKNVKFFFTNVTTSFDGFAFAVFSRNQNFTQLISHTDTFQVSGDVISNNVVYSEPIVPPALSNVTSTSFIWGKFFLFDNDNEIVSSSTIQFVVSKENIIPTSTIPSFFIPLKTCETQTFLNWSMSGVMCNFQNGVISSVNDAKSAMNTFVTDFGLFIRELFPLSVFINIHENFDRAMYASSTASSSIVLSSSDPSVFGGHSYTFITSSTIKDAGDKVGFDYRKLGSNIMYGGTYILMILGALSCLLALKNDSQKA